MWLQAIAIALPRIQDHYAVPDNNIGWLSTSLFAGMLIGAVGWGACMEYFILIVHDSNMALIGSHLGSDLFGRSLAFNATLVLTTVFGLFASVAPTYPLLCLALFLLGTAVGVRFRFLITKIRILT